MTFEFAHNFLRKLMNLEWDQLPFLNDKQKDGFFANPHTFFIRADDETARQIWDVLYPKPKEPAAGEAAKDAGAAKVIDLDAFRKAVQSPYFPPRREYKRKYDYWCPPRRFADPALEVTFGGGNIDYEYDTGKPYPNRDGTSADPLPKRSYIINGVTGDVTARAG